MTFANQQSTPALGMRPQLGEPLLRDPWGPFLAICHFDPQGVTAAYESLQALQTYSRFRFEVLNLWPMRNVTMQLPAGMNLDRYSGVYIHPTASYDADNLSALKAGLKAFKGIKILAKQDEQKKIRAVDAFAADVGVDLILTCLDLGSTPYVYPLCTKANVRFKRVLTGYVTDALVASANRPIETRELDITYRGSLQPLSFGRLAYEKRAIGVDVAAHPLVQSLRVDISSRWQDRITGPAWLEFLASSRAVLGVESGSEVFDLDGDIEKACDDFRRAHLEDDEWSEDYYRRAHEAVLRPHEGNVPYAQLSPRHFEAAATRTLQILYEGDYSGVFRPGVHYLPLKRDLSNLREILEIISDDSKVSEITARAHSDIIASGRYSWSGHVCELDDEFEEILSAHLSREGRTLSDRRRLALLCATHPEADPRIGWMTSSFERDFEIVQFGMRRDRARPAPEISLLREGVSRVCLDPALHGRVWRRPSWADTGRQGFAQFDWLEACSQASDENLNRMVGSWDATADQRTQFRARCRHLFDLNGALVHAALASGPFEVLICADLEALLAGCVLRQAWGSRLIYDAHEFWPHSSDMFPMWEREFWTRFESALLKHSDLNVTVNPLLAEVMSKEYGAPFHSAANAIRLDEGGAREAVDTAWRRRAQAAPVDYLFLGGFAPGRGIELLIDAWDSAPEGARLLLRGPEGHWKSQYVERARAAGLLDRTIFFSAPCSRNRTGFGLPRSRCRSHPLCADLDQQPPVLSEQDEPVHGRRSANSCQQHRIC